MANLARGGRGGTSLPPERMGSQRLAKTGAGPRVANSWSVAVLLIIVVGGLSMVLGYLMRKH